MAIDTSIALGVRPPQFQTIDPMTIYSAMENRRMNALRERALEQEMQRNALIMQNTIEDRRAAAARAAAARREQEELIRLFQGGYQPAKNPVMGPGTIQGATPAGFDYEGVKNKLIGAGRIDAFKTVSELQEQEAKRREAEAKATGQGFTNTKTQAETLGVLTENQKKMVELADAQLKQISMGIDRAPSIEAVNMLYDANPEALAVTGKTPAQAKAIFAQRAAEVGFDRARMEVANGVMAVQKQLSDEIKTLDSSQGTLEYRPGTGVARPIVIEGAQGSAPQAGQPTTAPAPRAGEVVRPKLTDAEVKAQAAKETLPEAIASGEQMLANIEAMVGSSNLGTGGNVPEHPGFKGGVGFSFPPFQGYFSGTDVSDFNERLKQTQGAAFLKAYETLKGTGQITEKEGEKATAAINRMNAAQSEKEFIQAAKEFYTLVSAGVARAKGKLAPESSAAPLSGTTSNGISFTIQP